MLWLTDQIVGLHGRIDEIVAVCHLWLNISLEAVFWAFNGGYELMDT